MSIPNIPESEVNWVYTIENKYKTYISEDRGYIYPVDILPPTLKKYVKLQNISTEYICIGPICGGPDGLTWSIWGWKSLPTNSSDRDADWSAIILAQKPRPTIDDIQQKLKHIQFELKQLDTLLERYAAAV